MRKNKKWITKSAAKWRTETTEKKDSEKSLVDRDGVEKDP